MRNEKYELITTLRTDLLTNRVNKSWHNIAMIMDGDIGSILEHIANELN